MCRTATLALVLAAALTAGHAAADCAPPYLFRWNTHGSYLLSMAVGGGDGNLYVLDGAAVVRVYGPDGALLHQWVASYPSWYPYDIAADAQGNVYVTDLVAVNKFTSAGTFVRKWFPGAGCQFGPDGGSPTAIAVDAQGNVYTMTGEGPRMEKFTGDGTLLAAWDVQTAHCGDYAIAVDGQGVVYVIDKYGSYGAAYDVSVLRYTSNGNLLGQWGPFEGAQDIAVDGDGRVYVNVPYGGILTLAGDGTVLCAWDPSIGGLGTGRAVAAGPSGYVYVMDDLSPYIAKFGDVPTPTHRPTWGSMKAIYR